MEGENKILRNFCIEEQTAIDIYTLHWYIYKYSYYSGGF